MNDMEHRLDRIVAVLRAISAGDYSPANEIDPGKDKLGEVESGINDVLMDLQTLDLANQEKAASLELQQKSLLEKLKTIDEQRQFMEDQARELEEKLRMIDSQALAIRELSTPILELDDDVIVLPIIGILDSRRSLDLTTKLLEYIASRHSKFVILDVTGVEVIDTKTADHLMKVVQAVAFMGARCNVTGMRPAVAQTLVDIGVDLKGARTLRNLKEGLRDAQLGLRKSQQQRKAQRQRKGQPEQ